jgi:hypothetical protein
MKIRKLSNQGWAHWLLPLFVVIIVGAVGVHILTASHAAELSVCSNNPSSDIAAVPDVNNPTDSLEAINHARAVEGMSSMNINLSAFEAQSIPTQLFILTNLERTACGLTPLSGMLNSLNASSQTGANNNQDPHKPITGYSDGITPTIMGGNLAWGYTNTIGADYTWMYNDSGSAWAHRANILLQQSQGCQMFMGAATATLPPPTNITYTEAIAEYCYSVPTDINLTWAQAEAAIGLNQAPNPDLGTTLGVNQSIKAGQYLLSSDGSYKLNLSSNGFLDVINSSGSDVWSPNTEQTGSGNFLVLQSDGNLVLYTSSNQPIWNAATYGRGGTQLVMQTDGNLVLYTSSNTPVWSSWYGLEPVNASTASTGGPTHTPSWGSWHDIGGQTYDAPTAASLGAGNYNIFYRGTDNSIYQMAWTGSKWITADLGGLTYSAPTVLVTPGPRLDVFVRGINNHLWQLTWTPSGWGQWHDIGGYILSAPTAASIGAGNYNIFYIGANNQIYQQGWTGSNWIIGDLGGGSYSAPAALATAGPRLDVFVRGTNNDIYQTTWTPSGWSQWYSTGVYTVDGLSAVSLAAGNYNVFYRGPDSAVYQMGWNGAGWTLAYLAGQTGSAPAAVVTPGYSRIDLFIRGPNNDIWQNTWQ